MAKIRSYGRPRSKYGNEKVIHEGVRFDSKGELKRWGELQLWELAGGIKELRRQVRFNLEVVTWDKKVVVLESYVADFVYWEVAGNGQEDFRVEDWKGHRTRDYIRKRKWMKMVYNIDIFESGLTKTKSRRRIKPHG